MGCKVSIITLFLFLIALPFKATDAAQPVIESRGSLVMIPCVGASQHKDSLIALEWIKDGKVLVDSLDAENSLDSSRYALDTEQYALSINDSRTSDSAIYTCRGYNGDDKANRTKLFEMSTQIIINDVPSRPGKPIAKAVGPYEISVEWTPSERENNSTIDDYILLVRSENDIAWDKALTVSTKGTTNSTTIKGLQPYTGYEVAVKAHNSVGDSMPSDPSDMVYTDEALPSLNAKPRITNTTNYTHAIYIEWTPPKRHVLNGQLQGYLLSYKKNDAEDSYVKAEFKPKMTTLSSCEISNHSSQIYICPNTSTSFNFTDLSAYTLYQISVQAFTKMGEGPLASIYIWTDEGVPSKPRITNIANRSDTFLQVEWERPEETNGHLLGYEIFWSIREGNITSDRISANNDDPIGSYTIQNLEPYKDYELQVAAFTRKGSSDKSDVYPGLTDVTGPSAPTISNLTSNSSISMKVEWVRPETFYKQIDMYQIKYKAEDSFFYTEMNVFTSNMLKSTQEVGSDVSYFSHQVVISNLSPNKKYEVQIAGATKSIFYEKFYTGLYSDARYLQLQGKEQADGLASSQSVTAGVVTGIICTSILLILTIVAFIVMRRYMKRNYHFIPDPEANHIGTNAVILPETFGSYNSMYFDQYASTLSKPPETSMEADAGKVCVLDEERDPIGVDEFAAHVASLHADSDLGFSQEYEEINRKIRLDLTAHHSTDPENKHKNRYINIMAYDHSRVTLKAINGKTKGSDYVNANFVDGYLESNVYIASQGPLPTTFDDFWRMIWEQNTAVVCMITNLTERGRRKCDQYWPNEGEHTYGNVAVKLLNTYTMAHYTIRVFTIRHTKVRKYRSTRGSIIGNIGHMGGSQKGSGERLVYQYHYTDWPDHGVPDFTLPVLMYVRKSAAANPESAGPILIHCSAGVGRTGTYIMLDTMMRQIKDKNNISIYNFLCHIRQQRNYLVQTEDQYIFIHDALLEYILSGETEVKDSNLVKYIEDLNVFKDSGPTLMETQYKLAVSFKPKDFHLSSATLPVNESKNRSKILLPVEISRVRLPTQPGEEGSDYINASYVQGYNRNEEFIVTQHPMESTIQDFWRMVWDKNCMTIVLLSSTADEDCPEFWPQKDVTEEYGHFTVSFIEETHHLGQIHRSFLLQSTQDDYECTTKMIATTMWPENCSPLSSSFELTQLVKGWQTENQENQGPIIVIDKYGGTQAATFCALYTLQDQLNHEGSVDVYMVAKLYHLKRPGIFPRLEDYKLLYRTLESVCEDQTPAGDRDSGISNCNNYSATMPPSQYTNSSLNKETRHETSTM